MNIRRLMVSGLKALVGGLLILQSVGATTPFVTFTNVTTQAGIVGKNDLAWGAPLWGDLNGDGKLDFITPNHTSKPKFWINNGNGTFTAKTNADMGVVSPPGDTLDWHGFALVDINNDGILDLNITEGAKKGAAVKSDLIFYGTASGKFVYAIPPLPRFNIPGRGRAEVWFDYNLDGYLDLFVKNYSSDNVIYLNDKGTNLIADTGAAPAFESLTTGSIMSVADYNLDGLPDIMVTGMGSTSTEGFKDTLFRGEANGTFTDVTANSGISTTSGSRGIAWGDYDNDGYPDLVLARGFDDTTGVLHSAEDISNQLYHNNGDGTFTNVTKKAGISTAQTNTWDAVWGDFDNDGWMDLIIFQLGDSTGKNNNNLVYRNNHNGTFTEIGTQCGLADQSNDPLYRHLAGALADYDGDGFLDLAVKCGEGRQGGYVQLFHNNGNSNHWLEIRLVGTDSNRQGIGATVQVATSALTQKQQYFGSDGGQLYSQGAAPLHFGLALDKTATVTVLWPNGNTQTLTNVNSNQILTITEASSKFSASSYTVAQVGQQNRYTMTVTGVHCQQVKSVSLESSAAATFSSFTVVNDTTITININTNPSIPLIEALDVFFKLSDGSIVTAADSFSTFSITLPATDIGYENIQYGTDSTGKPLDINIYRPKVAAGPLPTILWIHGGAFKGGNRKGVMPRILTMTTMGYAVVSMDYRLAPDFIFDAQIEDAKAVVRFIRANAATYGLDPDNIGVAGGSSGGFLAALLATSGGFADFETEYGNHEYSSRVKAACVLYGGTDLVSLAQIRGLDATSNEAAMLGVAPLDDIALSIYASPTTYVSSDDAPSLLLYGSLDDVAPPQQGQLLNDLLVAAGIYSKLEILPYGHDFPTDTPQMDADIYAFFDSYLKPAPEVLAITGVSPTRVVVGQTTTVIVTGKAFSALDSWAVGPSALGVQIQATTFVDAHTWQLSIKASSTAKIGKRDLTIANSSGMVATAAQILSVETDAPPPVVGSLTITSLTPATVQQGQTVAMQLTGTGFTSGLTLGFAPSALGVRVENGMVVSTDGTTVNFSVTAASTATVGGRDLVVTTTGGSTATLANAFTVTAPPPVIVPVTIAGLTPNAVPQGQTVAMQLTGTGFTSGLTLGFAPSALGVHVEDGMVVSADGTTVNFSVTATSTATVGGRDLVVTTTGGSTATLANAFTVTAPPPVIVPVTITGLTPNTVQQGQTVAMQLTGTGLTSGLTLSFAPSALGVHVEDGMVVSADGTTVNFSVTATSTATVGGRDLVVTTTGGSTATLASAFTVTAPPPVIVPVTITGLTPNTVQQGQTVGMQLTGTGFTSGLTLGFAPSALGVRMENGMVVSADGTTVNFSVTATSTATTGGRDLVVTTTGGSTATLANAFTVTAPPPVIVPVTITGLTPNTVQQGQTVAMQLTGTGFTGGLTFGFAPSALGVRVEDGMVVSADGTTVNFSVTATSTATTGGRDLVVTTTGGSTATLANAFTVTAPPPVIVPVTITGLTPNTVQQGQTVAMQLTGTGFTSETTLSFAPSALGVRVENGMVISADGTTITFSVTATSTATLGGRDLVVTAAGGTATRVSAISVTSPPVTVPLTVTSLTPNKVQQEQTVAMQLKGTGFTSALTLGFTPSALGVHLENGMVISADGTTASINISASSTATVGGRDLVVTVGGSTVTLTNALSVTAAPLTTSSLAVTSIKVNQTMTTRLTGTGFSSGTTIVIGPTPLGLRISTMTLIDTHTLELTFVASSTARVGVRDLTLTNPDGTTVTLPSAISVVSP